MILFPNLELGTTAFRPRELKIGEALKISRIPERFNERRLTQFINYISEQPQLGRKLSDQERYYVLLEYLDASSESLIGVDFDFDSYRLKLEGEWKQNVNIDGVIVSHLTGAHLELLESQSDDAADWYLGAMMLRCEYGNWEPMPSFDEPSAKHAEALINRIKVFERLAQSEADEIVQKYLAGVEELTYFLRTGVDATGVTVHGGADDAPTRFRTSTAFGWVARQLGGYLAQPDQQTNA